jgi:ankyrin repeat protein
MEPKDQYVQAIKDGNVAHVRELLQAYPDLLALHLNGNLSPVLFALYYNEVETAQAIIAAGAPLDVFTAAGCGQLARLHSLLDERPALANIYAGDGFQPLGLAAFFGQVEAVRLLLARGAAVNSPSRNPMRVMPLHSAAANRHLEVCRLLIAAGADVNATQADDFTPLHAAAQNDDIALARLLLENGADASLATVEGITPLALAQQEDSTQVVALLK